MKEAQGNKSVCDEDGKKLMGMQSTAVSGECWKLKKPYLNEFYDLSYFMTYEGNQSLVVLESM